MSNFNFRIVIVYSIIVYKDSAGVSDRGKSSLTHRTSGHQVWSQWNLVSNDLSVAPSDVFAVQHNPLELSDEQGEIGGRTDTYNTPSGGGPGVFVKYPGKVTYEALDGTIFKPSSFPV